MTKKKILLGTTALLAAGFFSGSALGQAATVPGATMGNYGLRLTGDLTFGFRFQTQHPAQNIVGLDTANANNADDVADGTLNDERRNHNFQLSGRLNFEGTSPRSASGTQAGFFVALEIAGQELLNANGKASGGGDRATNTNLFGNGGMGCSNTNTQSVASGCGINRSDMIDQNYIWVDGRYGKVFAGGIGGTQGANPASQLQIGIPRTFQGAGAVTGADPDADPPVNAAGRVRVQSSAFNPGAHTGGQENRVVYLPPSMAGFRLGLVYVPDTSMENTLLPTQKDDDGATGAAADAHIQWSGKIASLATRFSASYGTSFAEDKRPYSTVGGVAARNNGGATAAGVYETGIDIEDSKRWRLGGDMTYAQFRFGAYYFSSNINGPSVLPSETRTTWGVGGTYDYSRDWQVGIGIERSKQNVRDSTEGAAFGTELGTDTAKRWDVGVRYAGLGAGKTITVGYRAEDFDTFGDNVHGPQAGATGDLETDGDTKLRTIDARYDWEVLRGLNQSVALQRYNYTHHSGLTANNPQQKTSYGILLTTKVTF